MELWQLGATFTLSEDEEEALKEQEKQDRKAGRHRKPLSSNRGKKRDLVAERLAYADGTGPKPEPDAPGEDQQLFLMRAGELGVPVGGD